MITRIRLRGRHMTGTAKPGPPNEPPPPPAPSPPPGWRRWLPTVGMLIITLWLLVPFMLAGSETAPYSATGLHMAMLGGVWQALLTGFAGARVRDGILCLDPRLPAVWGSLGLRFRCPGHRVRLDITREAVDVRTDGALRLRLGADDPRHVAGSARLLRRSR